MSSGVLITLLISSLQLQRDIEDLRRENKNNILKVKAQTTQRVKELETLLDDKEDECEALRRDYSDVEQQLHTLKR